MRMGVIEMRMRVEDPISGDWTNQCCIWAHNSCRLEHDIARGFVSIE